MASYTNPSRLGAVNDTTGTFALDTAIFLEVFSGEVLEAFDTLQVTLDRQMTKTISSGKSAQFPQTWKASAAYHAAGAELDPGVIKHAKKTINIENLLVASVFVDKLDEAMNHYDQRRIYAHQLSEALVDIYDKNSFRAVARGAEVTTSRFDPDGTADELAIGKKISGAGTSTIASTLKGYVYDAAETLDAKNVPSGDRFAAFLPLAWYLLLEDGEFIDRDFAGEGSKARARLPWASDLLVLKSNNLPTDNSTASALVPDVLEGNDTQLVSAIWHRDAIATVKLLDLTVEDEKSVRHKGTLLTADYAVGQDFIRPEGCVTLLDTNL